MHRTISLRPLGATAAGELSARLEPMLRTWAVDWFAEAPAPGLEFGNAGDEAVVVAVWGARGEEQLGAIWPQGASLRSMFGSEGFAADDPRTVRVVGDALSDLVLRLLGEGAKATLGAARHGTLDPRRQVVLKATLGHDAWFELHLDARLRDRWCPRRPAERIPLASRGDSAAAAPVAVEATLALGRFALGEVAALTPGDVLLAEASAKAWLRTPDGRIALTVEPRACGGRRAVLTRANETTSKLEGAR